MIRSDRLEVCLLPNSPLLHGCERMQMSMKDIQVLEPIKERWRLLPCKMLLQQQKDFTLLPTSEIVVLLTF